MSDWQGRWLNDFRGFTPAEWHWPTALVTALTLVVLALTHRAIGHLVRRSATGMRTSGALSPSAVQSLVDYFLLVGQLKTVKRTGWVHHRVPHPESVADHMYRLTVMTGALTRLPHQSPHFGLALLQSLIHDQAEALVGDIVPTEFSGVTKAQKATLESKAMDDIVAKLQPCSSDLAKLSRELFDDYETNSSQSAKLLHDLDKLEMILQAYEYEKRKWDTESDSDECSEQMPLDRFYESKHRIVDGTVRRLADEVDHRRQSLVAAREQRQVKQ